jgi:hypothetical protein
MRLAKNSVDTAGLRERNIAKTDEDALIYLHSVPHFARLHFLNRVEITGLPMLGDQRVIAVACAILEIAVAIQWPVAGAQLREIALAGVCEDGKNAL